MTKLILPIAIVCVLAAAGLIFWRYRRWPPAAWAAMVKRRARELRDRHHALLHPDAAHRSPAEVLRDDLFEQQKNSVGVEVLARFKGIGPKTVETLRAAGIRSLAKAEAHTTAFLFKKNLDNIGNAREELIASAVEQLLIDERRRFDAGVTPQGQEYRRRLAELSFEEQQRAAARDRERLAVERCLEETRPLEELANQVTFASFLRKSSPGITDVVMARPLPEVIIESAPVPDRPLPPAPSAPVPPSVLPDAARLQAFCRFGLLVAKSDGRIAAAERGVIRGHLGDLFGSDPFLLRRLDPELERAERNLPSESEAVETIKLLAPRHDWPALYAFAERIADAIGGRTEKESALLARLATAFDLVEDEPTVPPPPQTPKVNSAREILGIPERAELSVELIRRRYAILSEPICPEKAASLGPEFAVLAQEKLAALRAAAEELLAPFGEPLEPRDAPAPVKDLRHNPDLDDLFGA